MGAEAGEVWGSFAHDPRDRAHVDLRASDHDRDVVAGVLTAAYADGRIDRDEHAARTQTLASAKTLGELPPLMSDLVPQHPSPRVSGSLVGLSREELRDRAHQRWQERRRSAILGFLGPTVICWAIYLAVNGLDSSAFPWPLIVMAVAGLHVLRVLTGHREIVREEAEALEKQQAKQLKRRGRGR